MRKVLIWVGGAVGVLAGLAVIALVAAMAIVDGDFIADRASQAAEAQTGQPLVFTQTPDVSLFPTFRLDAMGARLGPEDAPLVTIGRLDVAVPVLPALFGTITVERLIVEDVTAVVEIDEQGRSPLFGPQEGQTTPPEPAGGGGPGGGALPDIRLGEVRLSNLEVRYANAMTGQTVDVREGGLTVSLPDLAQPLALRGGAVVNGEQVDLALDIQDLRALAQGGATTLAARLDTRLATAALDVTSDAGATAADGTVAVEVANLPAVLDWLQVAGASPVGAVSATGDVGLGAGVFRLSDLTILADAVALAGSATLDTTHRTPRLVATLATNDFALDPFLAGDDPGADGAAPARPADGGGHAGGGQGGPLPWDALTAANLDLKLALGRLTIDGTPIGPGDVTVGLEDGVLAVGITETQVLGGTVAGQVDADAGSQSFGLDLTLAEIAPAPLLAAAADIQADGVRVGGRAAASGTGATVPQLIETLTASYDLAVTGDRLVVPDPRGDTPVTMTDLALSASLPRIDGRLSVEGGLVAQDRPVELEVAADNVRAILAGETRQVSVALRSDPASLRFGGTLALDPAATGPAVIKNLVGMGQANIPSLRAVAQWLALPLPQDLPVDRIQFDGLLDMEGLAAASDGFSLALDDITVNGMAGVDLSGPVPMVRARLTTGDFTIDRFLDLGAGATDGPAAAPAPEGPAAEATALPWQALADAGAEVDVAVTLGRIGVRGTAIGPGAVSVRLADGVLDLDLDQVSALDGEISGTVDADAGAARIQTDLRLDGLAPGPLLAEVAELRSDGLTLSGTLTGDGQGQGLDALLDGLSAAVDLDLAARGLWVPDPRGDAPVAIRDLALAVALPTLDGQLTIDGGLTAQGQPLTLTLSASNVRALVAGQAQPVALDLSSQPATVRFDGRLGLDAAKAGAEALTDLDGTILIDVPSISAASRWLALPLPDGVAAETLRFEGPVTATAQSAALPNFALTLDETQASGRLEASLAEPMRLDADIRMGAVDLNRYLPQADTDADSQPAPAGDAPTDWSDEPIDFSFLDTTTIDARLVSDGIRYGEIDLGAATYSVTLRDGVLAVDVPELPVFEGVVSADVDVTRVDGGARVAAVLSGSGIAARPMLQALAGTGDLSGTTDLSVDVITQGGTERQLVTALDGTTWVTFRDGSLRGINIPAILRNPVAAATGRLGDVAQETDFAEFGASFQITDGIAATQDIRMLAPLFRVDGQGTISLPPRQLDLSLNPVATASLEGQGGQFDRGGLRIPIRVRGSFENPRIEPDFSNIDIRALADPNRVGDALRDPGGTLRGLLGGGQPGGGSAPAGPAPDDTAPAAEDPPAPAEATPPAEPAPANPLDTLRRGLFGN